MPLQPRHKGVRGTPRRIESIQFTKCEGDPHKTIYRKSRQRATSDNRDAVKPALLANTHTRLNELVRNCS